MFEIFQYGFMLNALIAGLIIASVAPLIGTFLVVRRYSLLADTLAHVSLVGVAVGILTRTSPMIVALIASLLASLGIERLQSAKKIGGESVLALFLTGSLALAVVLISSVKVASMNFSSFLFGSISTVSVKDLYVMAMLGIMVLSVTLALYKGLFLVSLDEELAIASGVNARLLNSVLVVSAGATVALSMRIVGALLVGALMVIPVLAAMQYQRGFRQGMALSFVFALVSVISGLVLSYYFDLASGGTIVLVTLLIFIISLFINRKQTVISK